MAAADLRKRGSAIVSDCAGIILAGGLNRRMAGRNKALLSIDGEPILDRLLRVFHLFCDPIMIVTNRPEEYLLREEMIVTDLIDRRSSLTGLYSGLFHAPRSHALVAGCDMPYLKREMVELLLENLEPRWDVVTPRTAAGYQPLIAVYSRRCLPFMARQLAERRYKISGFFPQVRVREVPEADLRRVDPDLVSFFNINTPADLQAPPPALDRFSS